MVLLLPGDETCDEISELVGHKPIAVLHVL